MYIVYIGGDANTVDVCKLPLLIVCVYIYIYIHIYLNIPCKSSVDWGTQLIFFFFLFSVQAMGICCSWVFMILNDILITPVTVTNLGLNGAIVYVIKKH